MLNLNKVGKMKTGTVIGTTTNNGYLITNIPFSDVVVGAINKDGQGTAVIQVYIGNGNNWGFYVLGTINNSLTPFANVQVTIQYYYVGAEYFM